MFCLHQLANLTRDDWHKKREEREKTEGQAGGCVVTARAPEPKVELTWVVETGETIEYEIGVPEPVMTDDHFATMTKKIWKLFRQDFNRMIDTETDIDTVIEEVLDALSDVDDDELTFRARFRDLFVASKMSRGW